jgi:WD40 repeat protein
VWDTKTGKLKRRHDSDDGVNAAAWSPDGTTLAVGSDKKIRVWAGHCVDKPIFEQAIENITQVAYSNDGKWFGVTGGKGKEEGFVWIYKVEKEAYVLNVKMELPSAVMCFEFSPDKEGSRHFVHGGMICVILPLPRRYHSPPPPSLPKSLTSVLVIPF